MDKKAGNRIQSWILEWLLFRSKAWQIGRASCRERHFYPKTKIGEFEIEAYNLSVGDKILIQGPTTGSQEAEVISMMVDDIPAQEAKKGDILTLPINFKIRPSDKLYKVIKV